MIQKSTIGAVLATSIAVAACPHTVGAQGIAVKVDAPAGIKTPVARIPNINVAISNQQRPSDWGVQMTLRHKRDRLQGAAGSSGTKAQ